MANPDIVEYILAHMDKVPIDDLRRYLTKEGTSDLDFEEALLIAQSKRRPTAPPLIRKRSSSAPMAVIFAVIALALVGGAFYFYKSFAKGPLKETLGLEKKRSAELEAKLGQEAPSADGPKREGAEAVTAELAKQDAEHKVKLDLATAYNTEGRPDAAVDILMVLIQDSQKPQMVGMTDFSKTAPAMIIQASYYRELARSFGLKKDSDRQQRALAKAGELEKKAEALNSQERALVKNVEKDKAASHQKEIDDLLK